MFVVGFLAGSISAAVLAVGFMMWLGYEEEEEEEEEEEAGAWRWEYEAAKEARPQRTAGVEAMSVHL